MFGEMVDTSRHAIEDGDKALAERRVNDVRAELVALARQPGANLGAQCRLGTAPPTGFERLERFASWVAHWIACGAWCWPGRGSSPGQRPKAVDNRWVDDVRCHRGDGCRRLDSPLVGLSGVRRRSRRRFRRSAIADMHATRALIQLATERASAILTLRQAMALRLFCDGSPIATNRASTGSAQLTRPVGRLPTSGG